MLCCPSTAASRRGDAIGGGLAQTPMFRDGLPTFPSLRRFSVLMAGRLTLWMTVLIFTPLADFYVFTVQDMTTETGGLVAAMLPMFLLFPAMAAGVIYLRNWTLHVVEVGLMPT